MIWRKIHILLRTANCLCKQMHYFLYLQRRPYTSAAWSPPKATYSLSLIMFSPSRMMGRYSAFRCAYTSTITWIVSWQLWFPGCDPVSLQLQHCRDSESTVQIPPKTRYEEAPLTFIPTEQIGLCLISAAAIIKLISILAVFIYHTIYTQPERN